MRASKVATSAAAQDKDKTGGAQKLLEGCIVLKALITKLRNLHPPPFPRIYNTDLNQVIFVGMAVLVVFMAPRIHTGSPESPYVNYGASLYAYWTAHIRISHL